jgi:hypothetical protein
VDTSVLEEYAAFIFGAGGNVDGVMTICRDLFLILVDDVNNCGFVWQQFIKISVSARSGCQKIDFTFKSI